MRTALGNQGNKLIFNWGIKMTNQITEIKDLIAEARENIDSILQITQNCDDSKHTVCYFGESSFTITSMEHDKHTRREQISFGYCCLPQDVEDYIDNYEEMELG